MDQLTEKNEQEKALRIKVRYGLVLLRQYQGCCPIPYRLLDISYAFYNISTRCISLTIPKQADALELLSRASTLILFTAVLAVVVVFAQENDEKGTAEENGEGKFPGGYISCAAVYGCLTFLLY